LSGYKFPGIVIRTPGERRKNRATVNHIFKILRELKNVGEFADLIDSIGYIQKITKNRDIIPIIHYCGKHKGVNSYSSEGSLTGQKWSARSRRDCE